MIKTRSQALDVFRGLTVALMILVNNPGSWSFVYPPFLHAPWHGLTPTDLVFPFFLFAVGNALSLVELDLKKIAKRTMIIFFIGLILNWLPFYTWVGDELMFKSFSNLRIMGVLQRIALAYGCAAVICFYFKRRTLWISLSILALYWFLCESLGSGDVYSLEGWFGTSFDRAFFGLTHLYQGEGVAFDPEGIMSTIPSISQVLLGFWVGQKLKEFPVRRVLQYFCGMGFITIALALIFSQFHPINKKIWTGSYVLVTTGMAMMILGILVQFLDVNKRGHRLSGFFEAFGKNPLFIFVLSGFIPKMATLFRPNPLKWFYENVCALIPGVPENGSLFYALLLVVIYGGLAMWLDSRKIYIRV